MVTVQSVILCLPLPPLFLLPFVSVFLSKPSVLGWGEAQNLDLLGGCYRDCKQLIVLSRMICLPSKDPIATQIYSIWGY